MLTINNDIVAIAFGTLGTRNTLVEVRIYPLTLKPLLQNQSHLK
ncbi:MAG: hypothetical protein AAF728_18545 [Cyanobacteria bacterium P01_D01_bin.128]